MKNKRYINITTLEKVTVLDIREAGKDFNRITVIDYERDNPNIEGMRQFTKPFSAFSKVYAKLTQ